MKLIAPSIILCLITSASAASLVVGGLANIHLAGHGPPSLSGEGVNPPSFSFTSGPGQVLIVSGVTGIVSLDTGASLGNGPDGGAFLAPTGITSLNGISGIHANQTGFLIGVFLSSVEPSDPAPPVLDFRTAGITTAFATLSPLIGQTFFVGDGLTGTGSGSLQQFNVPPTATRLFLGITDGFDGTIGGPPRAFQDNGGSFSATFQIVPEPSSAVFLVLGGVVLLRRRTSR